jgi:quinoprotein glucose dehydrogenase
VRLVKPDSEQSDFTYRRGRSGLRGPQGLPLVKPPYSRLTAIDLTTGEHAWQVPLGDGPRQQIVDLGAPDPGPLGGNGYTGPVVTKTLLFVGVRGYRQTGESPVLNAYDKATGDIVHSLELPQSLTGTPMTYMDDGRQYVVAAYSNGGDAGLLALALP